MKIVNSDTVQVISGKDKGREGKVTKVFAKNNTIIVKGLNLFKKHVKSTQNQSGGIITKERPLAVSKVALICPSCKKTTRVGYSVDKSGHKYRICKRCQALLTTPSTK